MDGWRPFMRLLHVPVERFEVELQLAEILGVVLELCRFSTQCCHQTVECPIEEEQIECEVASADLHGILATDEAEIAAKFDEKLFELFDQPSLEVNTASQWAGGRPRKSYGTPCDARLGTCLPRNCSARCSSAVLVRPAP